MRSGADALLPKDAKTKRSTHTVANVYSEMLFQVARDYNGAGDLEGMTLGRIAFWYRGLRAELHEATKPRDKRSRS